MTLLINVATGSLRLGEMVVAQCEQVQREVPWMLTGTSAHPGLGWRIASPYSDGVVACPAGDKACSQGMVDELRRDRSAGALWPLEVVPLLTETERLDPATGDFGRVLGVDSMVGLCFRLRSGWGRTSRPDRTFLLRGTTGHFYCGLTEERESGHSSAFLTPHPKGESVRGVNRTSCLPSPTAARRGRIATSDRRWRGRRPSPRPPRRRSGRRSSEARSAGHGRAWSR